MVFLVAEELHMHTKTEQTAVVSESCPKCKSGGMSHTHKHGGESLLTPGPIEWSSGEMSRAVQ